LIACRLCPQIKVPAAINSAHIKLIDLRVDTLHVAADLDFLLADFFNRGLGRLGWCAPGPNAYEHENALKFKSHAAILNFSTH
jgi:hypothetical protein